MNHSVRRSSMPGRASTLITCALGLVGLLPAISGTPAAAELAFDRSEVVLGSAKRQTVLTGFLLGGAMADLAVVSVDDNDHRRLQVYAFDGSTWVQRVDALLDPDVVFVDVAGIGGRDRLLTVRSGRLSWFDPDSARERPLVEVATRYDASPAGLAYGGAEPKGPFDAGEIPHVDITRDLNRDGRDDLILPDPDGFTVFIQTSDGTFSDALRLGPPEPFRDRTAFGETRTYGEVGVTPLTVPWYLSRVHQMDYDHDGRSDLVFWNGDHFDVHLQDARGLFSPTAETFTVDAPFDSDGPYSLLFGFIDKSMFSQIFGFGKRNDRTVLHSLSDINGDGVADLVTVSLKGRSLLRLRTGYEVHFGARTSGGTSFARDPGASIPPQGKAPPGYSSQWLQDFDGDDRIDILYGEVRTGVGGMIRALFGTSLTLSSRLYRLEDGAYPDRPTTKRRIRADIDIRGGGRDAGFFPAVLVGDVNGDGCSDVLVGKNRRQLHVFLGGPQLFARKPQELAVPVPGDERNSWLVDLNRDGKQDILMHHPSAHRVTVVIPR